MARLSGARLNREERHDGEIKPHYEGRRKAGIILMGRIKYQEAIGLEVKRGRPLAAPVSPGRRARLE